MSILPKVKYNFDPIPIKIPNSRNRKNIPKLHVQIQKTLNSQSNPEQKRAMLEVS
jgi:hypothetical protein